MAVKFCIFITLSVLSVSNGEYTDLPKDLFRFENDPQTLKADPRICEICETAIDEFIKMVRADTPQEVLAQMYSQYCNQFSTVGEVGCEGRVDHHLGPLIFMIKNRPKITGAYICGIYNQDIGCAYPGEEYWTVDIPKKTTDIVNFAANRTEVENLKILHITDIHFDNLYKPGSDAKCNLPVCCQSDSGDPITPENGAGFWGDYNVCDQPWYSVLDLLDHVNEVHEKIDYVYFTGDLMSHINWRTSQVGNTNDIRQMYKQLKESFGSIPVFSILGNHEVHPTNFYSPEDVRNEHSTHWIYEVVDEEWSRWLPRSTSESVLKGGYYSVLVRPGFRVIGLNSNYCYIRNLWLFYYEPDPLGMLQWLVSELLLAEQNSEMVHILSHVPPGDVQCEKRWMREYNRIVRRFSHIIKGQFNGHTHYDELRLYYDEEDPTKVVNAAYNGGSFATYVACNPNYRMFDVDGRNYDILNFEQWIYNLTEANLTPDVRPRWFREYSFVDDYELGSLTMENLGKLVKRMEEDKSLVHQYCRYFHRDSDILVPTVCTEESMNKFLCTIKNVDYDGAIKCYLNN